MPDIEVTGSVASQVHRVFGGQWWLPTDPEARFGGVLEFVKGQGGQLWLQGGFALEDLPPNIADLIVAILWLAPDCSVAHA
jgi:hypothetical protein